MGHATWPSRGGCRCEVGEPQGIGVPLSPWPPRQLPSLPAPGGLLGFLTLSPDRPPPSGGELGARSPPGEESTLSPGSPVSAAAPCARPGAARSKARAAPDAAGFQIDSYEKLYEEVSRCPSARVFHGWLQCDCRPFKQALLNTIRRWSLMFKRYLSDHVINRWAAARAPGEAGTSQGFLGGLLQPCPRGPPAYQALTVPRSDARNPRAPRAAGEAGMGKPVTGATGSVGAVTGTCGGVT